MKKEFKKSDLKPFMRVEGSGKRYSGIVVKRDGNLYVMNCDGGYYNLISHTYDLTYHDDNFTINAIWDAPSIADTLDHNERGKLLWERKKEDSLIEVDGVEYSKSTVESIIKKHTNILK